MEKFELEKNYAILLGENATKATAKCILIDTCRQGYRAYFEVNDNPDYIVWGPISGDSYCEQVDTEDFFVSAAVKR